MTEHTDQPRRRAAILGITGQDGAYLARLLLAKGYEVHGTSRDAEARSFAALERLRIRQQVSLHSVALTDFRSVMLVLNKIRPDEVYNLTGQSSVALSFEQPVETFESIAVGTLNVLDALRFLDKPVRFFNAGSSECLGNTAEPATEATPFMPRSPYATAKAAAIWTVANYREAYGMFACSSICANHESPLRSPRFVTRKIVQAAVRIAGGSGETLPLGNLAVERDWGWAPEYVEAFWRMLQAKTPDDYVVATGETNALSDFVAEAFSCVGLEWKSHVTVQQELMRPSEILRSALKPEKIARELGWRAGHKMRDVVRLLVDSERGLTTDEAPESSAAAV
jgi:GDPmannose 4,6-dehydratase